MSIMKKLILSSLRKEGKRFFTISDICSPFDISNNYASQIIYQLKMDGKVEEIEKGKYTLPEEEEFPFLIAYKTVQPSYISFKTALYVYKMREDWEGEVYVATPKRKRPLEFKTYNFRYITLKPYKFFGFCSTTINGNKVIIAEPEKAIIDSLEQMEYGPDLIMFKEILKDSFNFISVGKIINYACRCRDKSLMARLGYLLEVIGAEVNIRKKFLPKDYIKLDPTREKQGKWISKWNIIDNL